MNHSSKPYGLAVFIRTNTLDFAEFAVPFSTLAEMVQICSLQPPDAILQQVIIRAEVENEPWVLTLNYATACKGGEMANLPVSVA